VEAEVVLAMTNIDRAFSPQFLVRMTVIQQGRYTDAYLKRLGPQLAEVYPGRSEDHRRPARLRLTQGWVE